MPKRTKRWTHLRGLEQIRYLNLLTECTIDDDDDEEVHPDSDPFWGDVDTKCMIDLSCVLELTRYLERGQYAAAVKDEVAQQQLVTDRMLDANCHMQRRSFDFIYTLIRDHPCFCPSEGRPQVDVRVQLLVALARFCCLGSASRKFAASFKVSHGSVLTYCSRVCEALIAVEERFIRWPSAARRRVLEDYGLSEFGFEGYIGNQDGTHFYLKHSPAFQCYPESYYDTMHSGGYGYNVLLTADHTGSIIHYSLGWPGSVHDASIQQHSLMYREPWKFFEKGQYIFVDCGFLRTMTSVPPYKEPAGQLPHNSAFNHAMRKGRCRIEHVNAQLKSRFGSLKKIPIAINEASDHERANNWIRACLILHNILIRLKDEWEFYEVPEEFEGPSVSDDRRDISGKEFQDMVRDRWLAKHLF